MTKLKEDYIIEKKSFTTGVFLPQPGAIYMCMIIIFKQLFSKPTANQGQTLCGSLLETGNVNFVKMGLLT